jgi:hypothetical protein
MVTQVEKIWLFETEISDPYIFGKVDGVEILMQNDRLIKNISVDKAVFYISTIGKAGLTYTKKYGGEDIDSLTNNGKTRTDYTITFNLPVLSQGTITRMFGREYSVLGMRRDGTFFLCLGRFVAENLRIDNQVQQRISLSCENSQAKLYDVISYNFAIEENVITCEEPSGDKEGFDYLFDFKMN